MSIEENKAKTRQVVEEFWNQGNMALFDKIWATNFVNHDPFHPHVSDREGYKQWVIIVRTAFPDFKITIEDMIAEGDKVVVRWTFRGTQKGELPGIPPTGKQVTQMGININRIADGKVVESWRSADDFGLLQQLGVIPPMERGGE